MEYLNQFRKHLANHSYPNLLSLWEEYCLGDEIDGEELKQILLDIKNSDFAESFGRHVEKGLPLCNTIQEENVRHEIFKLIVDLETTNPPYLAQQIIEYLEKKYPSDPYFKDKIRLIGLREQTDFKGAVSNYELLTHMKQGSFVFHYGGWGVGQILDVSFLREELCLEFDYVPGKKDLSFHNAFKTLIPLSDDHFLARRFGNPDMLEEYAKKHPVEVVYMLLRDLGPLTAAEIKEELCELVIPTEDWVRWWQTARTKIKKDTKIETPSHINQPFKPSHSETTHEARLQKALEKKPDANVLIQLVYTFLRDFPAALRSKDFKDNLQGKLKEALLVEELSDAQALQIHFFLQDLLGESASTSVEEIIKRLPSVEDVIHSTLILSFKKRILLDVKKYRQDWSDIFLNLFLTLEYNPLKDYLFNGLLQAKLTHAIEKQLNVLLSFPDRYPQAVIWYLQKIMKDPNLPLADQEGKNRFFEAFLILLNSLEQQAQRRELIKKMHHFLTANRYSNVRKIFEKANRAAVQEFLLLATKCHSLSDQDIKILHSLAQVVHPSLKKLSKKYEDQETQAPTPIWTTEAGYKKIKKKIEEISTVETVKNAKKIEEARAHGDLRENAEFKAALEERTRLQGELKLLSTQFNQARILTPNDVRLDVVDVGVIITLKDEKGDQIRYTLLGPWDADPEKHILSFQSKLAQSLIGKKIGDAVTIQQQHFTITNLQNYFDTL